MDESWKAIIGLIKSYGGSTNIIWDLEDPSAISRYAAPTRKVTGLTAECKGGNQVTIANLSPIEIKNLATTHGHIDIDDSSQWKI